MKGALSIKPKKSKYQLHKEQEEERKRKEEEEAAKVYEEFVESFAGTDEERSSVKTFVRGGTVQPGQRSHEAAGQKGSKYVPSFMPPSLAAGGSASKQRPEPGRVHQRHNAFADDEEEDESVFKLPVKKPEKDKPRQIDRMLEELKREQEEREERDRLRREGKPLPPELMRSGSSASGDGYDRDRDYYDRDRDRGGRGFHGYDDGDPYSTNLYVGNIHPEVNEAHLAREFGRFGPIGSVKIMWPRDEEQRRKGRNCGFVAFMNREDAEKALKSLDGLALHGMEMNIGWGKAVPLPPVPLYSGVGVPTGPLTAIVPPAVTRERGNPITLAIQSALMPATGMFAKESTQTREVIKGVGTNVEVKLPDDPKTRYIIDSMALYVLKDGCEFEQLIMMEHQGQPDFRFLFRLDSPEHIYYRWRLYSLAEGDTLRTWRIDPYLMLEGGQAWIPPPMLEADLAATNKRQESARGQQAVLLSDYERDMFEDMLRGLTAERATIADAMVFALEHADAAADVCEILEEALTLPETAPATKMARLFLVNDILHNSTAPVRNASRYRARLESVLPEVFVSFNSSYKTADSRMVQEAVRRNVLKLLRVWRERFIFNDDYINGLQATMLGHIPTMEQAEEEEMIQQQALAAEAAKAAAAAAPVEVEDDQAPQKAKSRWEEDEEDELQQQQQQQQPELQPEPEITTAKIQGPTAPRMSQLRGLNPRLEAELEGLTSEELERRCRVNGLSNKGSRELCMERLLALDHYVNGDQRGMAAKPIVIDSAAIAAAAKAAQEAAAAVSAASGHRTSKWDTGVLPQPQLQQQQQQQQADGSGAAAAASSSGSRWGGTISIPLDGMTPAAAAAAGHVTPPAAAADQQAVAAPAAPAAVANRWQEVDEQAEKQSAPQGPVSKWLLEEAAAAAEAAAEAEAQRKKEEGEAAAAAAREAAAAAARETAARAAIAGSTGGGGGGAVPVTPEDEERKKRLRQIELKVLDHQDELQEQGRSAAQAEAAAAALRQQLVADLDAELTAAAAAAAAAKAVESKPNRENSKSGVGRAETADRDRDRTRDRESRDHGRDRVAPSRDRDKDRDGRVDNRGAGGSKSVGDRSARKRSRSRSRSRGRSSRGDRDNSSSEQQQQQQPPEKKPLRRGGGNTASKGAREKIETTRDKDREKSERDKDKSGKDKGKDSRDRDRERDKSRRSRRSSGSRSRSRSVSRERRRRSRSKSRDRDKRGSSRERSKRHRSR